MATSAATRDFSSKIFIFILLAFLTAFSTADDNDEQISSTTPISSSGKIFKDNVTIYCVYLL